MNKAKEVYRIVCDGRVLYRGTFRDCIGWTLVDANLLANPSESGSYWIELDR